MTKIAGSESGSISQRHGSADPDAFSKVSLFRYTGKKANRSYCDGQVREEEEETDEPMEQEPEQQQQTARTKKTLNYEEYKKMSYLLIKYIKQKEEQGELEEAGTGTGTSFVNRDILDLFLSVWLSCSLKSAY
jgi:hypothetical protein